MANLRRGLSASAALAAALISLAACTSVQLVSKYDEVIDRDAQALQKKMDAYLLSLQSAGPEQRKFKSQRKFYEGALVDLNALQVRAAGIHRNNRTLEQISFAKENLAYLVLLHKGCATAPLSGEQKEKVKDNGVDLSLDCRRESGATVEAQGRGESALNPALVRPVQDLFNQLFGAIMALELAKKRGEDQ